MKRLSPLVFCTIFIAGAAHAQSAAQKEAQMAAWKAIASTSGAIDGCTERHVTEYPAADGVVKIDAVITKNGTVGQATATTSLEGARNLRPCLENVAKSWKFPPIQADTEKLSLTVHVKKGQKFVLKKPGEKDEAKPAGAQQQEETMFDFLPTGWSESPK